MGIEEFMHPINLIDDPGLLSDELHNLLRHNGGALTIGGQRGILAVGEVAEYSPGICPLVIEVDTLGDAIGMPCCG